MAATIKRVRVKHDGDARTENVRMRQLHVLHEKYWCMLLNNWNKKIRQLILLEIAEEIASILNQLTKCSEQLKTWKDNGVSIIGYARKSTSSSISSEGRLNCLRRMVDILHCRSGADLVYVSPSSCSSQSIASRDTRNEDDVRVTIQNCDGDTQG